MLDNLLWLTYSTAIFKSAAVELFGDYLISFICQFDSLHVNHKKIDTREKFSFFQSKLTTAPDKKLLNVVQEEFASNQYMYLLLCSHGNCKLASIAKDPKSCDLKKNRRVCNVLCSYSIFVSL